MARLCPSDKVRPAAGDELVVVSAEAGDSGSYRCEADNVYSRADSSVTVTVEGRCPPPG